MTVQELIEKLKKQPQKNTVLLTVLNSTDSTNDAKGVTSLGTVTYIEDFQ